MAETTSENIVVTLRYYKVGSATCTECKKLGTVVRMAITTTNQILVTMLCEDCGGEEITGLLDREEMVATPDGTALMNAQVADRLREVIAGANLSRPDNSYLPKNVPPKAKQAVQLSTLFKGYRRKHKRA